MSKNQLQKFGYDIFTTILRHRNLLIYDKDTTELREFYENFTMFCK